MMMHSVAGEAEMSTDGVEFDDEDIDDEVHNLELELAG